MTDFREEKPRDKKINPNGLTAERVFGYNKSANT